MPKKNKQQKPWYDIKAMGEDSAELLIYGNIGPSFWDDESVTAKQLIEDLKGVAGKDLTVRINSVGGSVADGIAIFNALRRHDGTVTTSVDAVAYSAASLIAMAGETVEMAENGLLMIHAPMSRAAGNAKEMRRMADVLDKHADAMTSAYLRDDGPDEETVDGWLKDGEDHYFTASEALELGLIDSTNDALDIAASADFDFNNFVKPAAVVATTKKEASMPTKVKKPAATPQPAEPVAGGTPVVDNVAEIESAAEKRAMEKIQARNNELNDVFALHINAAGVHELKAKVIADTSITVDQARAQLLDHLGKDSTPGQAPGRVEMGTDEREKFVSAASDSIMLRAGLADKDVKANIGQNPLRGRKLLDIAEKCAVKAGVRTDGMDQMQIVAAAFTQSTSDFPVLLENTMHKALQQAYATVSDTWRRFCAVGSVSDFRAHNRYRVGSLSNLDALNELGEFKNKTIPDGEKGSITATTKGNIINISRQTIINDDLAAFIGLAAMLGRAGARTIESDVYALLALASGLGPVMADGKTLFHADHGNIGTAAAISMAAIDADRVKMASQKDVGGNDYLDLRPDVLLVPVALGGTARTINEAQYDPDTANKLQKPNMVNGLFSDIVDSPRLSGTRRYMFADPNEAPVLEVAFLDGNDEPFLDMENGFTVDGARYKARLDFGVSAIDFRGALTNAGA